MDIREGAVADFRQVVCDYCGAELARRCRHPETKAEYVFGVHIERVRTYLERAAPTPVEG
jgi:hypothetical protein